MRSRIFFAIVCLVFIFSISSSCWAGATMEDEDEVVHYHLQKFSRGVVNIASSPFEVPNQMIKRAKQQDSTAGQLAGYITGIFTGAGWAVWRCTSGVVDIATTPFCGNTEGLVTPEFITDDEPVEW